ncbi:hypothetical protein IFVP18_C2100035 [Vibrio parahaemolyticus]
MGEGNYLTDFKYIRDNGPKNITKFFYKLRRLSLCIMIVLLVIFLIFSPKPLTSVGGYHPLRLYV